MVRVCEHITLSLGILDKILPQNLFLIEYLHCKVLASPLWLSHITFKSELLNEVNHAKGPLTQLHNGFEILRPDKFLVLLGLSLQLLIQLPNLYELIFEACLGLLTLSGVVDLDLLSIRHGLLLLLLLESFDKLFLIGVLVLDVLLKLAKLVHQRSDLRNSVVVEKDS